MDQMRHQQNRYFIYEKLRGLFRVFESKVDDIEQVRDDIIVKAGIGQAKSHVGPAGHAFGDRDHPAPREVDPQHVIAPFDLDHRQIREIEKGCAPERNSCRCARRTAPRARCWSKTCDSGAGYRRPRASHRPGKSSVRRVGW